ncbi:MAG: PHP domain-containing protein, partial [Verrucomicrobia bacterium]|nr:PHP domain-containing protein [Verrucomicrobiota bacterium]
MYADLHLHTRFSDGTFGPEELAAAASNHGLNAIALTDHDTIEGCTHMEAPCQELGIRFITGCEFTAATPAGDEIHILGYCLNPGCEALLDRLSHYQQVRQDRVLSMVARLNEAGVPLSVDVVWKLAGCKSPGRPHIARALVQEGFCSSPDEA